jgi:DNA-binding transcriptional MerR regulator
MSGHSSNLTPAQAAGLLGVSGSTLRRWSSDYADRLSEAARPGPGRKRSYTPDDLATLQRARDLLNAGKSPIEVGALLGVAPAALTPTGAALVTLPSMAGELAQAIEVIGQLQQIAQSTRADLDRLRDEHAGTRADLDRLQAELSALERRGFWDRVLNRKPTGPA